MSYTPQIASLSTSIDQRSKILKEVVPFIESIFPIYGNDVLTATYIEPQKTKGGVWLPDDRVGESVYQGKVGLVIALGIDAFKYRDGYAFFARQDGENDDDYSKRISELIPKVGDWVFYRPVGGIWKCTIKGFACQFVRDSEIKGRVSDPDVVF